MKETEKTGQNQSPEDNNGKSKETMLELNFCEFPITSLTRQRNFKALIFNDTITDPATGNQFHRRWTVDGSLIVGTPIAEDKKVLQVIIHLMKEEKCFKSGVNQLFCTIYKLCKALNWPIDGRYYEKIKDSLVRLACGKIHAQYSFWDHKQHKLLIDEVVNIFDELKIYGKRTGKPEIDCYLWDEPYAKIVLSRRLFESIQSEYTNTVPLGLYLSLDDPTTQRLYEVLVKKLHKTSEYFFDVKTLCYEYMGMSRIYKDIGRLKQNLNKANENLKKRGFLKTYSYPKKYKGKRICYVKVAPEIDELRTKAIELACRVRTEFWSENPPSPTDREKENIYRLIQRVGYEKTNQIMSCIIRWAGDDGFNATWIGGLLSAYGLKAEKYVEQLNKNQLDLNIKSIQTEQEENHRQQEQKEFHEWKAKIALLSDKEKKELKQQAIKNQQANGQVVTNLGTEIEMVNIYKQTE